MMKPFTDMPPDQEFFKHLISSVPITCPSLLLSLARSVRGTAALAEHRLDVLDDRIQCPRFIWCPQRGDRSRSSIPNDITRSPLSKTTSYLVGSHMAKRMRRFDVTFDYSVGTDVSRLSIAQGQKAPIARAALEREEFVGGGIICNGSLSC